MRNEKYICTIFAVLITLYVNSQLNGFHDLMVFTIIEFQNTRENVFKRKKVTKTIIIIIIKIKTVSKSAPQSSVI